MSLAASMSTKKDFQWTDDESELLLSCTLQYKVNKIMISDDWEQIKSKVS